MGGFEDPTIDREWFEGEDGWGGLDMAVVVRMRVSRVWGWGKECDYSGTEVVGRAGCLGLWFRVVGFIGGGSGSGFGTMEEEGS